MKNILLRRISDWLNWFVCSIVPNDLGFFRLNVALVNCSFCTNWQRYNFFERQNEVLCAEMLERVLVYHVREMV